jgi:hypothetical protein
MPKGVSCSVSNCSYWGDGNLCGAKEISVEIDAHADGRWNAEFADEFGDHQDAATTSSVTCCLTFQPKKSR